jgi:hypothetical protein
VVAKGANWTTESVVVRKFGEARCLSVEASLREWSRKCRGSLCLFLVDLSNYLFQSGVVYMVIDHR